jgi:putative membrane protein
MKRWIQIPLACALALAVSACAGDRSPAVDETGAVGTSGTVGVDRDVVHEQLQMGQAEIELGELAQQRGTHPEVKQFGERMVREHRAAGEELKRIAGAHTTAMPPSDATPGATGTSGTARPAYGDDRPGMETGAVTLSDDYREFRDELSRLSGAEFDRKYIDRMVDDHEKAVNDLEDKAEGADNAEIKSWASKTLPKVREHLEMAKRIQQTLEQSGDNRR